MSDDKIQTTVTSNEEEQAHLVSSTASNTSNLLNMTQRIIWCMFIPDQADQSNQTGEISNESFKLFCVTRKNKADVYNLSMIEKNYDCSVELESRNIAVGHLSIRDHTSTILTATFSPDASAITTSSVDGEVNLFKISFDPNENLIDEDDTGIVGVETNKILIPRCLKKWQPHGEKPVNSLYFLDDHKKMQPDEQFWSFLITCN
jgi:enhancer of mRNA-decapping protein 4